MDPFTLETDFVFNCEVMKFMDSQLRVRFYNDFDNPILGNFVNTSVSFNASG